MTNKTKNIRAAVAMLAVALLGALAVGCGGGSSDKNSANEVDRAFVRQMIPHHESAVAMADVAINEAQRGDLKTGLAPSIISEQNAEIKQMKTIFAALDVKTASMEADAKTLGIPADAMGMSEHGGGNSGAKSMGDELKGAKPFDRAFLDAMIPHHQGAIRMARAELAGGDNAELKAIAKNIEASQTREIKQMNAWRVQWYGAPSPAGGVPAA